MSVSGPPWAWERDAKEREMLRAAMPDACLVTHGPPDFPVDARILGVCGVSATNADPNKYGWIVADFLSWKTIFHGVGNDAAKTWLTSLDLSEFLGGIEGVDVAQDDPINNIVGQNNDRLIKIPNDNGGFVTEFEKHVANAARSAAVQNTTLVIMVFAPVTPDQDICVDFGKPGEDKIYLTTEQLRKTIRDAVGNIPVVLLTPSPFTGGWLCRPSFMGQPGLVPSDKLRRMIARSCGGTFAESFILSFTRRTTPLLTEVERKKVTYDDPMPLHPTELQTKLLHGFQRQIHEALEQRLSVFAREHAFILQEDAAKDPSSFCDSWESYGARTGRSMTFWGMRWAKPRALAQGVARFEFLGEAFGGSRESQLFHLRYLAAIELETCPGDWATFANRATHELLTGLFQTLGARERQLMRVFDAIEYRASSMILAQMIAKAFDLPMPNGTKCRYWHDKIGGVDDEFYKKFQSAFGEAHNLFDKAAVLPSEKRHEFKSVRFSRVARWLSAAIALKFQDHSRQAIEKFVLEDVAPLIAKVRDTQKSLLLEHPIVTRAGRNWLAALGLVDESPQEATLASTVSTGNRGATEAGRNWAAALQTDRENRQTAAAPLRIQDSQTGQGPPKKIVPPWIQERQIGQVQAKEIDRFSGENWGHQDTKTEVWEMKSSSEKPATMFAAAERSPAQNGVKPAAPPFEKPAAMFAETEPNPAQNGVKPAAPPSEKPAAMFAEAERSPAQSDMKPAVQDLDNFDTHPAINQKYPDTTALGARAVQISGAKCQEPAESRVLPLNGGIGEESTVRTSSAPNGNLTAKQTNGVPKKVSEAAMKENGVRESVAPPQAARAAAPFPVAETGNRVDKPTETAAFIAEIFRKASELISKDVATKESGESSSERDKATQMAACLAETLQKIAELMKDEAMKTSGEGSSERDNEIPATNEAWGSMQGAGGTDETAQRPVEHITNSFELRTGAPQLNGGHCTRDVNLSTDSTTVEHSSPSTTEEHPSPPRTPVTQSQAEETGPDESTEENKEQLLIQTADDGETGGSNETPGHSGPSAQAGLTAGTDFFTLAGISWP